MRIYDIDQAIDALLNDVDPETGEILFDPDKLNELQMEKDRKVENLALYIKNTSAEAKAIAVEEQTLEARRKTLERAVDRAKDYLIFVLQGEKFTTPRVAISYRKSTKLELEDSFFEWANEHPDYLRQKAPEANKTAITAALKSGEAIPGAVLVENHSMVIK